MCGAYGPRIAFIRRTLFLLSGSVSLAAVAGVARAQETTTLPEVRVIAPSPVPAATRRPTRPAPAPATRQARTQAPAPTPVPPAEPGEIGRASCRGRGYV